MLISRPLDSIKNTSEISSSNGTVNLYSLLQMQAVRNNDTNQVKTCIEFVYYYKQKELYTPSTIYDGYCSILTLENPSKVSAIDDQS